jgi:MFS family permease
VPSSLSSSIVKHNFTGVVSLVADSQSSAYAFGGLLAFGTFQIHGGSLADWRYLFALEGNLTVCIAIVAFIFLPYSAAHAKFLTEDEKELALYRMQVDLSSLVNEPFVFRDTIAILKEPTS